MSKSQLITTIMLAQFIEFALTFSFIFWLVFFAFAVGAQAKTFQGAFTDGLKVTSALGGFVIIDILLQLFIDYARSK